MYYNNYSLNQLCSGNAFVALKANSKLPQEYDWPNSGKSFEDAVSLNGNVGILLGHQSGILDVDLDCREAKQLADVILPSPAAIFDRGTSDSGHYLYFASSFGSRKSFSANGANATLVELRGNGAQTMIPPSVHPNGDTLVLNEVNLDQHPLEYQDLLSKVSLLAACAEIAQNWREGYRHDLAVSTAGLLLKSGLTPELIHQIIERICFIADDAEIDDRLKAVVTSTQKPDAELKGYTGLVECLGEDKAKRIAGRLSVKALCTPVRDVVRMEALGLEAVNFRQFSDRSNITEAKVGTAFGKWLRNRAVYVIERKQWMIWTGVIWAPDYRNAINKLAFEFITEAKSAMVEARQFSEATNLTNFESLNKLENIARYASIDLAVSATDFDKEPLLIATQTNWVNLSNGNVQAPDPNVLVSKIASTGFNPSAKCPTFLAFLNDIFEEDQSLIEFVQKAVGYSLTGSTSEQCLFIMIGDGANGKSTFVNVINNLLGTYGTTAAAHTLVATGGTSVGDDLVDLIGARLITVSETEEGQSLAEAKIKQMTGGDTLKGRPLYGNWISFSIIGKLWLATNSLPQINNTDHGIWRRIKAIPFQRTFKAEEQDKALGEKLMAELSGILNWAIEGCLKWQQEGLTPPEIVERQTAEYKCSMDSISQFISDECVVGSEHSMSSSRFYERYRDWCSRSGRKPQPQSAFKRQLEKIERVYQKRTSSGMHWYGISPCLTV